MENQKNAEKIVKLIQDKDFLIKLSKTKTNEEANKLFLSNGVKLDVEKLGVMREAVDVAMKKVDEIELDKVVGGVGVKISVKMSFKQIIATVAAAALAGAALYEGMDIIETARGMSSFSKESFKNFYEPDGALYESKGGSEKVKDYLAIIIHKHFFDKW